MTDRKCDTIFKGCCNPEVSYENVDSRKESLAHHNLGTGSVEHAQHQYASGVIYSNYNGTDMQSHNNVLTTGYYNNEYDGQFTNKDIEAYINKQSQEANNNYASQGYIQGQGYTQSQEYTQGQGYTQSQEYTQGQGYTQGQEYTQGQGYTQSQIYTQGQGHEGTYESVYYNTKHEAQFNEQYLQNYGANSAENYENVYTQQYKDGEVPVINIKGDQPIYSVPVYQDKYLRDRIVEVPKYEIQDVVQPKIYTQETKHDVPTIELIYKEKKIEIPKHQIAEKPVEIDVPIGYTPIYAPKWDVREVPRPIPKYEGEQKVIEVEVPQIKYIDKYVEKEIVVDVKEKIIPKITEIEKPIDVVKYEWKEEYQDVPVYKYVPKIDVELDCPPPLIVPYPDARFQNVAHVVNPNQSAADIPPAVLINNINLPKSGNAHVNESMKKTLLEIARSATPQKTENKEKKSWFFWKNKKTDETKPNDSGKYEIDPETGYPKAMPKDFAHYFKKDLNRVEKQMSEKGDRRKNLDKDSMEYKIMDHLKKSPVNPTVEYLGKVDKPPIDGGKLDGISFKLHAIEVHQFIPVPSLPKPRFLDLVPPEKIENNDISGLENVFGSVPDGWVDPNVTGFIAPMMNDVLQGNMQPKSPLLNKLSIGNISQKKKSFAVLTSEDQRSIHKEVPSENLSYNNSSSYINQVSAYNSFQKNDSYYDAPN